MKCCPNCGADVEGLIHHCDLCGESLDTRKYLFSCGIHELQSGLGFSRLAWDMIETLEPQDSSKYAAFLERVLLSLVCLPTGLLTDMNIKNRITYSEKKRVARITVIVDYDEFVRSDKKRKSALVATAINLATHMLELRLRKSGYSIDELVFQADTILSGIKEQ